MPSLRDPRSLLSAGCAVGALLLFLHQVRLFSHAVGIGIDDAYIGFIYTRNLVEHGEMNWTVGGERVEGYTNFLWLLLMAVPHALHWPLAPTFKAAGLAAAAGGVALLCRLPVAAGDDAAARRPLYVLLLAAGASNIALYAVSGIETTLFFLWIALGAFLHLRTPARPLGSALAFGAAALTRPEGHLFFALSFAHRLAERAPWRELVLRAAAFGALAGPHLLFRRLYYGLWLPHSFYVKAGGYDRLEQWRNGFAQLRAFYGGPGLVILAGVASALLVARGQLRTKVYVLGNAAVHALYLCSIGYDFMPKHRHQVMAYPFLLTLSAMGIAGWERLAARVRPWLGTVAGLGLAAAGGFFLLDLDTTPMAFHTHGGLGTFDVRREIGLHLGRTTAPDALLATGECGKIPYFARRDDIDLSGINDIEIGKRRPYVERKPAPLPLDILLARAPEVVLIPTFQLGLSRQPVDDVGKLSPVPTFREPAFLARYRLSEERVQGLYFYVFRRRDG